METLIAVIPGAIAAAIVAIAVVTSQRALKAFAAALENDPDVVAVPPRWGQARCHTRRAPLVDVISTGGGKNNPHRWEATASAPRVGARTTLQLSREGSIGALRELLGAKDIHIGDDELDKAFTVRGSEPDVVRGIFASAAMRDALLALFSVPAWRIDVAGDGVLIARFPRNGMDAMQAKRAALAVALFVEILERHADAPPVALASSLPQGAGGGATGAPVGVPIGSGR